ncbi:MAG: HAMP domain-containing histidine kinase [Anaerolineales bacterium]|nr:HAMP domain-containing histidine kinase [Anaerolineales bacterium]
MENENKGNGYLYKSALFLRNGLADVQKKTQDLYRLEELEDFANLTDSPLDHLSAALSPLVEQVNDFLDYAHTVTGTMALELEEVDVSAIVDSVMNIADQLAERKGGLELEEEIPENLPTLEADPARLAQALLNYLHNAIKFTEKGRITLRVLREADQLVFEVRDTGIGIAEADQEKVFEPFETILEDKEDPRLGFGLGLKIVEHIIELHDGQTWFQSEVGVGSSFFLSIPL